MTERMVAVPADTVRNAITLLFELDPNGTVYTRRELSESLDGPSMVVIPEATARAYTNHGRPSYVDGRALWDTIHAALPPEPEPVAPLAKGDKINRKRFTTTPAEKISYIDGVDPVVVVFVDSESVLWERSDGVRHHFGRPTEVYRFGESEPAPFPEAEDTP